MSSDMFELRTVTTPGDVRLLGDWLLLQAKTSETVSIAVKKRPKKIAISTRDEAWVIDSKLPIAELAIPVLRDRLVEGRIRLMFRTTRLDLPQLVRYLGGDLGMLQLLSKVTVGDLTSAAACINQPVTEPQKFKRIDHDAFEIALLEPQYVQSGMPKYYEKVGLPVSKLHAEADFTGTVKPAWFVEYPDLWIKVLAYYTQDPTLLYDIVDGTDIRQTVARIFHVTPEEAELLLLWCACGFDTDTFRQRFGNRTRDLPENLPEWRAHISRKLPNLYNNIESMKRSYEQLRVANTLYDRRLRPGHSSGDAVAFRIFGTAEDIINVAAATYWTNRPTSDTMIIGISELANSWRVLGVGPGNEVENQAWLTYLKTLAPLADPLGQIALRPQVMSVPQS